MKPENAREIYQHAVVPVAVLCIIIACIGTATAAVFITGPITELQRLDQENQTYIITGDCNVSAPTALYVEADNITITANEPVTLTQEPGWNARGVAITTNVQQTTITNITFSGFLYGVECGNGVGNTTISACRIENGSMASEPAIRVLTSVDSLSIMDSYICDQEGVYGNSGTSTGFSIRNNTFSDIPDAAIDPLNLYDSVIENNTFTRCKYGIALNNANPDADAGLVINNNTFTEFSNIGIRLMDIGGISICDNTIVGDSAVTTPSTSSGIFLTYNVNATEISRNTIGRCGDYGIICFESSGITGTGNILRDNEQGLNIQRNGERIFSDMYLSGNSDGGIIINKDVEGDDTLTNITLASPETRLNFGGKNVRLKEAGALPEDVPNGYLFTGAIADIEEDSFGDTIECTITYYYTAEEIENITESGFAIFRADAPSGRVWTETASSVNTTTRTVSASYSFASGEEELFFALAGPVIPDEVTIMANLSAGWNMVSVPVRNTTYDIPFEVQPPIYRYNGNTYVAVTDISSIEGPDGYWVAATAPCTLTMTGVPVANFSRNSTAGWNMIGSTAIEIPFEGHLSSDPAGILTGYLYTYNPVAGTYETPTLSVPGCGYWVNAVSDGDIILD